MKEPELGLLDECHFPSQKNHSTSKNRMLQRHRRARPVRTAKLAAAMMLGSGLSASSSKQQLPRNRRHLTSQRVAQHDSLLGAPLCHEYGSSCDTGDTLIAGVGSYEQNSPNTIDGCGDQSASVQGQDESLDRILVRSKDGGTMTAGTALEVRATVSTAADVSSRSNPGHYETLHAYYHSEATGAWQYVCTQMTSPGAGNVTLSCEFEIPPGNYYADCGSSCGLQIVRLNYGYGEYAVEACTEVGIWDAQYSDVDDLAFFVAPAHSSSPSAVPSPPADSAAPSSSMTDSPSLLPSSTASHVPSASTDNPSSAPSSWPSSAPSNAPSAVSAKPTSAPSESPSMGTDPSGQPTTNPSTSSWPTSRPSSEPTAQLSAGNSSAKMPSGQPSMEPSSLLSLIPTIGGDPSVLPSHSPSATPSPTPQPSSKPSTSTAPWGHSSPPSSGSSMDHSISSMLSVEPSTNPSTSGLPTSKPRGPQNSPSSMPTTLPTSSAAPSFTIQPSFQPSWSLVLSNFPSSSIPTPNPSKSLAPTGQPQVESETTWPSSAPSEQPSILVSSPPSMSPTKRRAPSLQPSIAPSMSYFPSPHPSQQPSGAPTEEVVIPREPRISHPTQAIMAVYDPLLRAPLCYDYGSSCDTGGTLIAGVGDYEQNSPNTIDGCIDQSAAVHGQDESIDRIVIKSKDGATMTAGSTLELRVTVSTAVDVSSRSNPGHSEMAYMYYHSQSSGSWALLCAKTTPPGVGNVTFSCDFEIPEDNYYADCGSTCGIQAVRVNYGYGEYAVEACTETGLWDEQYSDADDLLFLVAAAPAHPSTVPSLIPSDFPTSSRSPSISLIPTLSPWFRTPSSQLSYHPSPYPSPLPSLKPSTSQSLSIRPSGSPSMIDAPPQDLMAAYDPDLMAPLCHEYGSSCDTGVSLIAGVGGYEQNSPNTIDGCDDKSAAVYGQDESIDRIVVESKDGGTMAAGVALELHVTVSTAVDVSLRSNPGLSETAYVYYLSQPNWTWQFICATTTPPGVGNVTFSCGLEIPVDNCFSETACGLQAVRVNYGYGEYAVEACTETGLWSVQYSDADDLLFLVASAPVSPSSSPSMKSSDSPSSSDCLGTPCLDSPPTFSPEERSISLPPVAFPSNSPSSHGSIDIHTGSPSPVPTALPTRERLSFSPSLSTSEFISTRIIAYYDTVMRAPQCTDIGSSCSSGNLLAGVGISETNAPNTIDKCKGEGRNITLDSPHDESVDRIAVRATNTENITAGEEVEVEVTLSSANDSSGRSIPNKWSVAHVYYSLAAFDKEGDIFWEYLKSFVVEPGSGENKFHFRFVVPPEGHGHDDGTANSSFLGSSSHPSAIRVSYGYAQYERNTCAGDGIEDPIYIDVDDLLFMVASAPISPTTMPTQINMSFPTSPPNCASGRPRKEWIIVVAIVIMARSFK